MREEWIEEYRHLAAGRGLCLLPPGTLDRWRDSGMSPSDAVEFHAHLSDEWEARPCAPYTTSPSVRT